MQGRIAGIITFGFLSFLLIGAAGAASDTYFETVRFTDTHKIECSADPMNGVHSAIGAPNCSVHRVSSTYGRQMMASKLTRDRYRED